MSTISSFKLDGKEVEGIKEFKDLEVSINFDNDSIQANINFPALSFVNAAHVALDDWENGIFGPTEGTPFETIIQDESGSAITFEGYVDHGTREIKSSVESVASVVKTNGLNGFHIRSQGITMLSLETSGIMPTSLGVNIPCVVENRKVLLEKLQIIGTTFITVKMGFDEVFKLVNIASDLVSGAAALVVAIINLAVTLANLALIIIRANNFIKQIRIDLFPKVFYHRGIKLITFLEKGCQKMGYTLDTGDFEEKFKNVVLLPHKRDETGAENADGEHTGILPDSALVNYQSGISGILKPNDFGYVLSDAFELANLMFFTKVAIIGNTVKLLPFNDPFWVTSPSYTMPDIKIEQSPFTQNGTRTKNIDELKARTLIEYVDDDSDKWTISNVNNSVSETIVEQININNERNVGLKGIDHVVIPYSLCIRKGPKGELSGLFSNLAKVNQQQVKDIQDTYAEFGETLTIVEAYELLVFGVEGALKIENQFFSTPKIVYLVNNKIPVNFNNIIGSPALYRDFHSYKSFVPGVKNQNDPNDTNQKFLVNDADIAFGPQKFDLVSNDSFFNTADGGIGKFTKLNWKMDSDRAVASYYIIQNYTDNLKENTT